MRVVAGATVVAQSIVMHVVVAVTGDALHGRIPVRTITRVTVAAADCRVCAEQREVRQGMVKRSFIEVYDIDITTLVLRVTGCTLLLLRRGEPPVKAALRTDVAANILMACDA